MLYIQTKCVAPKFLKIRLNEYFYLAYQNSRDSGWHFECIFRNCIYDSTQKNYKLRWPLSILIFFSP
jgi:hypothetical protein